MIIKWKIAGSVVVILLLAEVIAYFYFSPSVGGSITNGAWAGSNNYSCALDDGVMFVGDHHIVTTDGKRSQQTNWTDLAGTSEDPRINLSTSPNAHTDTGLVIQAHVSGDKLTFSSVVPSDNRPSTAREEAAMKQLLESLQHRQPWHRCMGIAKPLL